MKRILFVLGLIAGIALCAHRAGATTCTVPNTFVNGQVADAGQVNANFSALQTCGNSIDHNNIGSLGIFATQIIPTTVGQAIFGGSVQYEFANGLNVLGTLDFNSVPVVIGYNSGGGAPIKTIVVGTTFTATSCAANTLCLPSSPSGGGFTFPNSFAFTSGTTFACTANVTSPNPAPMLMVEPNTATTFTLEFDGADSSVGSAVTFHFTYACTGY